MEKVTIGEVDPDPRNGFRRILTAPLGTTGVAINRYEVPAGEWISGGWHAHHDQEEVFYVESGRATFQTEDGDASVGPGEAVRFAPGEFHHAYNAGDGAVVLLALGAPPGSDDVESFRECGECGEVFGHRRPANIGRVTDPDEVDAVHCPECGGGTERIGRPD